MQLDAFLTQFQDQLNAAAALGDERTREVAASLANAATPAVRLAVLGALSAAADETTAALLDHPGSPSVSARLDGDDVRIVVETRDPGTAPTEQRADDGDASARISLRLSESLKSDIDEAAAHESVSVNTWLVRAATGALTPNPFAQFGAGFAKLGGLATGRGQHGGHHSTQPSGQQHITGWIDG